VVVLVVLVVVVWWWWWSAVLEMSYCNACVLDKEH